MDNQETSTSRFELLVQSVTDYAIYMLSPEGIVTSWNPGAQRFKGYAPDEIIGDHFSRFYTQADKDAGLPQKVLETAERQGRFEAEGWRVRKDGTRFWANVVVDPIRDTTGKLVGFAKSPGI
jgi:PAS domain S-box-containing protein